jgi:hypothetical protein
MPFPFPGTSRNFFLRRFSAVAEFAICSESPESPKKKGESVI